LIAQHIQAELGQPGVVENKPGAGGIVATRQVAASAPDGLTILTAANSTLATQKANPKAGYDVERDLIPILNVGWIPNIMVASPELPVTSLHDVIALSRTRDMNFGTIGVGTTTHLMTEYIFRSLVNTKIQHVVYPGSGAALTAVASNQIELASVAMVAAVPLVRDQRIKALALTSSRRVATLPEVPTLAEAGFPRVDYVTWVGFFMPAHTPPAIVEQFTEAARKIIAMQEVTGKLVALSFEVEVTAGDAFRKQVSDELKHWGDVVKTVDIKVD
jgi:tripartite-type tricarboxylate transporter receptor subunit TctC